MPAKKQHAYILEQTGPRDFHVRLGYMDHGLFVWDHSKSPNAVLEDTRVATVSRARAILRERQAAENYPTDRVLGVMQEDQTFREEKL